MVIFKWLCENVSVGSCVVSFVLGMMLELVMLGCDDVLCFNIGDWVEIIDDCCEFL